MAGPHNYWHVQPMHTFRLYKGSRKLPTDERRRPDNAPTFPIDVVAPVDLLVCLMISLYGLHEARRMAVEFSKTLDDRFRQMRSCL